MLMPFFEVKIFPKTRKISAPLKHHEYIISSLFEKTGASFFKESPS
jgi:hypothetical protein